MKCMLFIFALTISIRGFGQGFPLKIDSVVNLEIEKQRNAGVREIGYTKLACIAGNAKTYLFWKKGKKAYIQKFEASEYNSKNIRRSRPLPFIDSVFFPFYEANKKFLAAEEVREFEIKPDHFMTISHSCFRHFKVFSEGVVLNKHFNFFDLHEFDEEQIDNSKLSKERIEELKREGWGVDTTYKNTPQKNINYSNNNAMKIIEWNMIVETFLSKLEDLNKFVEL